MLLRESLWVCWEQRWDVWEAGLGGLGARSRIQKLMQASLMSIQFVTFFEQGPFSTILLVPCVAGFGRGPREALGDLPPSTISTSSLNCGASVSLVRCSYRDKSLLYVFGDESWSVYGLPTSGIHHPTRNCTPLIFRC